MDASYSVTVDPSCGLVLIRLAGFFAADDVAALRASCAREYPKLGRTLNRHLTLIDLTGVDIQPRDGLDRFAALLDDPALHGRRIAFVVPLSLARSQARRIAGHRDHAAFFDHAQAAEAWLFAAASDAA